jgi:hypothetical protein
MGAGFSAQDRTVTVTGSVRRFFVFGINYAKPKRISFHLEAKQRGLFRFKAQKQVEPFAKQKRNKAKRSEKSEKRNEVKKQKQ